MVGYIYSPTMILLAVTCKLDIANQQCYFYIEMWNALRDNILNIRNSNLKHANLKKKCIMIMLRLISYTEN